MQRINVHGGRSSVMPIFLPLTYVVCGKIFSVVPVCQSVCLSIEGSPCDRSHGTPWPLPYPLPPGERNHLPLPHEERLSPTLLNLFKFVLLRTSLDLRLAFDWRPSTVHNWEHIYLRLYHASMLLRMTRTSYPFPLLYCVMSTWNKDKYRNGNSIRNKLWNCSVLLKLRYFSSRHTWGACKIRR